MSTRNIDLCFAYSLQFGAILQEDFSTDCIICGREAHEVERQGLKAAASRPRYSS